MKNLYQIALQTVSPIKLKKNGEAGHVGCALETVGGVVFTGICIDVPCSIGICAEQAAIAEMLKNEALPKEWTGSIKGIKLHGGKEISYSFKNGKRI